MTSFGIEWDTNVLIYLPDQKLPDGVIAKSTAVEGDKWSISLEHIRFQDIRKEVPETEKDCMYSLEAQIGVFESKENKFNIGDINSSIRNFRGMWNTLLKEGKITINNVPYPILTYRKTNSEIVGEKCYTDCGRNQKGSIEYYDENTNEKKYWRYVDIQENTSIMGKVQITIGIPLKYVFNIFKKHRELLNKCNVPQNKNCTTITRRSRLINIETAYDDAYRQFRLVLYPKPETEPDTTQCEILSFLMLLNYIIQTVIDTDKGKYFKAKFHVKLRTNLGIIYKNLDYDAGQILEEIFEQLEDHPNRYITNYGKGKFNIKSFLSNIRGNYGDYYMIEKNRNTPPTFIMNISPFGIYRIEDGFMSMIEENFTLTKVPYGSVYLGGEPAEVGLRATDTGGMTYFEISEGGDDVCEWGTDRNGNILLEFRGIETIVSLLDENYRDLINTNIGKGLYNTRDDTLESMIKKAINSFFNPILRTLDPTYIPVNSPRTIYSYPPPSPRESSREGSRSPVRSPVL